jgi:phosphatidylglycerophosphate synthase
MSNSYRYDASVKSRVSDELINTYLLRPIAGVLVGFLYPTRITPNQVTIASTIAGLCAGVAYSWGGPGAVAAGGVLVTLKDLLDSADGQLARARNQYSRQGRFLDSIGDFLANVAIFSGIAWTLFHSTGNPFAWVWAFLAFAGITLRVSYHVFYHTSYLHLQGSYEINRITEEKRGEDLEEDATTLILQTVFQVFYGWQDRLMVKIDTVCRSGRSGPRFLERWYSDRIALRLSGFLGFGTELFILMLCSVFYRLDLYLLLNLVAMNAIVVLSFLYRRMILRKRLEAE